jgi:hypothetical protein
MDTARGANSKTVEKSAKDGLLVPEMLVFDAILKTISMNRRYESQSCCPIGTREYCAKNSSDDPVENVVYG